MRVLVFWGLLLDFRAALSAAVIVVKAGVHPALTAAVRLGASVEEVLYRYAACEVLRWEAPDA